MELKKSSFSFLFFLFLLSSNKAIDPKSVIKLTDLVEQQFTINEYIIFEYENNYQKIFEESINFIFKTGNRPSTRVYI